MQDEYLNLTVRGPAATEIARKMFPCCPCPSHLTLSFALSDLPKGTVITMSTVGTPVNVSFPAPDAGSPLLKFTFHVTATDQNNNPVTPTGLTATSDNSNLVPTLGSDSVSFDIAVNDPGNVSGTVTITDAFGDTLAVVVSQTVTTPPQVITLSGTADAPVSQ